MDAGALGLISSQTPTPEAERCAWGEKFIPYLSSDLRDIGGKVLDGVRLSAKDGLALFHSQDLLGIGSLANIVRERKNGQAAYFVINRHINYTNICRNRCRFCAFSCDESDEDAYTLSLDDILAKAEEMSGVGLTEFHIVGGLNPKLPFSYYLEMLSALRERFPEVHIQAFTAVEIDFLAEISGLTVREALAELVDAGLTSLPGGGAEIFSPIVRREICPEKISGERWLEVMREAHQLGLYTNATMLYGHLENEYDWVEHLLQLRQLQDETGGFLAFIPLAFHPKHTDISWLSGATGYQDIKMLAISRLLLDNFPHIKAFWIMLGTKLAQVSLGFGVDDLDGTVVEEHITHAAGAETAQALSKQELIRLIVEAGRVPVERDTLYQKLTSYK